MCAVLLGSAIPVEGTEFFPITSFAEAVDAVSVRFDGTADTVELSAWNGEMWSAWQTLTLENEQDPLLRESNLMLLPLGTIALRLRGDTADVTLHPMRVSKEPTTYDVAATRRVSAPRILSRRDWGADESLLYADDPPPTPPTEERAHETDSETTPSNRMQDCEEVQEKYPQEFTVAKTVRESGGKKLKWSQQYSKNVKLLVVHHTALNVTGDPRPPVERVRALYQYHAQNRGWGDIGYNFLIDEEGKIYQGRAGGDYVVGGHAYCNNVGTIGIAMLGNFDREKPPLAQTQSLQWLLDDLAAQYDIDLQNNVKFHGKNLPAIVGHRDLVSTDCPGYYVSETMGQIRRNIVSGNVDAALRFPVIPKEQEGKPKKETSGVGRRPNESSSVYARRTASVLRKIRRAERLRDASGTNRLPPATSTGAPQKSRRAVPLAPYGTLTNPASSSNSGETAKSTNAKIRIRLTNVDAGLTSCAAANLATLRERYRGEISCIVLQEKPAIINTLSLEEYLAGLAEEPDTEPYEKQRAFAIAARTYAAYYMDEEHRKFPGQPYDGSDDPATFQAYSGRAFERKNPRWVAAVRTTAGQVLTKDTHIIKPPYFSSDDGRTRSPAEAGWSNFPFAEIFASKPDPWCEGQPMRGHGVGMSGCGAQAQANEGKTAEEILLYYYPGTRILDLTEATRTTY